MMILIVFMTIINMVMMVHDKWRLSWLRRLIQQNKCIYNVTKLNLFCSDKKTVIDNNLNGHIGVRTYYSNDDSMLEKIINELMLKHKNFILNKIIEKTDIITTKLIYDKL